RAWLLLPATSRATVRSIEPAVVTQALEYAACTAFLRTVHAVHPFHHLCQRRLAVADDDATQPGREQRQIVERIARDDAVRTISVEPLEHAQQRAALVDAAWQHVQEHVRRHDHIHGEGCE